MTTLRDAIGGDAVEKLARVALDLLVMAPQKRSRYAFWAKVPWSVLERGHGILDHAGVDRKRLHREYKARVKAARAERGGE